MSPASRRRAARPAVTWLRLLGGLGLAAAAALVLAPRASATQTTADPDAGRDVYAATCAMCHGTDATGMMGMHPALRGAVDRLTAEGVEVTIRNGRQTTPPMPAFADRLADQEIANVIAYLQTLPAGPRNFGPDTMDRDGMRRDGGMMDRDGMMHDGGMMDRVMGGGVAWAWILLAAVLILLILAVAVVVVIRRSNARENGGRGGEDARSILDRRYAAGELSREQYRQAREDLDR